ncbi:16S rRNA (guanine(527)-N(7))-methyltransferase RsmG [bacterium]|nr:16S rRNA (guanine(527)-N(7))-methyltransferase RsmG [bacterium]MBU1599469.1 16S rRNA (guanine(527)-N(7))-methyltransferase RsmG [bacterium]
MRLLRDAANKLGFPLSDQKIEKLLLYLDLLKIEGEKTNLVGTKEENKLITSHIIDSLTPLLVIEPQGKNLIDIGTGAGLPGIVLAISCESLKVSLLEARAKKVAFLEKVREKLFLSNISILMGRAEDYGRKEGFRESFDYGVVRALGSLSLSFELGLSFIKIGGELIVMKGREIEKVGALSILGGKIAEIKEISLPFISGDRRHLVVVRKIAPMGQKYPRRAGIPKKRPL